MKLIIDISDDDYEKVKDGHIPFNILEVMQNGTPMTGETWQKYADGIHAMGFREGYKLAKSEMT